MIFVFGGAHQGMEEYVLSQMGAKEIYMLDETCREIDFSRKVIGGVERFVLGCVRRGESARDYFESRAGEWQDSIIIGMDFSCGLVPMDAEKRMWRDENGRLNNYLTSRADQVVRLFCGLPQRLK